MSAFFRACDCIQRPLVGNTLLESHLADDHLDSVHFAVDMHRTAVLLTALTVTCAQARGANGFGASGFGFFDCLICTFRQSREVYIVRYMKLDLGTH